MTETDLLLRKVIGRALSGENSHTATAHLFDRLGWRLAGIRPGNAAHSIFDLLVHISFWQNWGIKWLDGEKPPLPRSETASWPGNPSPKNADEWRNKVRDFRLGLKGLQKRALKDLLQKNGTQTRLEMLHLLATHASYHAGQVVALRQMLNAWPPK